MRAAIILCAAVVISGFGGSVAAARTLDPCQLIRTRQLSKLLHTRAPTSSLAPLGPTCVYRFRGTRKELTITVERRALVDVKPEMSGRKAVRVRGRHGYCGTVGEPTLDVSLPHSKLLSIAGSELSTADRCRTARRMAAAALRFL